MSAAQGRYTYLPSGRSVLIASLGRGPAARDWRDVTCHFCERTHADLMRENPEVVMLEPHSEKPVCSSCAYKQAQAEVGSTQATNTTTP